jgi:Protein of unknown function (DUF2628)
MSEPAGFANVPPVWRTRFDFFDTYGLPSSSPAAQQAFRALPFGRKFRINSNVLAFLFGPIYFFVKGMWRKGLTLLGAALALAFVMFAIDAPDTVIRIANLIVPAMAMTIANYAYYLHVVRHSESWNPFEGFGRRTTQRNDTGF